MVAAHLIFSVYGFWLPNDPRGSWSDFVRSYELFLAAGPAKKVNHFDSVAHLPHDPADRVRGKLALALPDVLFDSAQARAVSQGFREAVEESAYRVAALAILPNHVHAVVATHRNTLAQIIRHLKTRATQELTRRGIHPFASFAGDDGTIPSVWARDGWKVFIDDAKQLANAIAYVEDNPVKAGLPEQKYRFVGK